MSSVEARKDSSIQEAIYNKRNLRMTVEGMLNRMEVGCQWRDLSEAFGCWVVIPRKSNYLKNKADMNWGLYRYRHLVKMPFARLK